MVVSFDYPALSIDELHKLSDVDLVCYTLGINKLTLSPSFMRSATPAQCDDYELSLRNALHLEALRFERLILKQNDLM